MFLRGVLNRSFPHADLFGQFAILLETLFFRNAQNCNAQVKTKAPLPHHKRKAFISLKKQKPNLSTNLPLLLSSCVCMFINIANQPAGAAGFEPSLPSIQVVAQPLSLSLASQISFIFTLRHRLSACVCHLSPSAGSPFAARFPIGRRRRGHHKRVVVVCVCVSIYFPFIPDLHPNHTPTPSALSPLPISTAFIKTDRPSLGTTLSLLSLSLCGLVWHGNMLLIIVALSLVTCFPHFPLAERRGF